MTRTLHVITHRRWVSDDLAAGAPADVEVRHGLGLDRPRFEPGDALWAPMEWATRALYDTRIEPAPLRLADPGHAFLPNVPPHLTQRSIGLRTLDALRRSVPGSTPDYAFFKPARCKVDGLPAQWSTREAFVARAFDLGCPPEMMVHFADIYLGLVEEHRIFIVDGEPVASSPYLIHDTPLGTTWNEDMTSDQTDAARAFARDVCAQVESQPCAYVLDVGLLGDGSWAVIEANPAWASNSYGSDPAGVIECLFAAASPEPIEWEMIPDYYLLLRAAQQRALPCD